MPPVLRSASCVVDPVAVRSSNSSGRINGILKLSVQLDSDQLKLCNLKPVHEPDREGMYVYEEQEKNTCAICLETIEPANAVNLACAAHWFHGQCIANHLQRDQRCPVCRDVPTSATSNEAAHEFAMDVCAMRIMHAFPATFVDEALEHFGVVPANVTGESPDSTPLERAEVLAEQLLNETDSEAEMDE